MFAFPKYRPDEVWLGQPEYFNADRGISLEQVYICLDMGFIMMVE